MVLDLIESSLNNGNCVGSGDLPGLGVSGARLMSGVEKRAVRWLWPGRMALGKLTLLMGDPGLGKSCVALDLAARITRGGVWPGEAGGSRAGDQSSRRELERPVCRVDGLSGCVEAGSVA